MLPPLTGEGKQPRLLRVQGFQHEQRVDAGVEPRHVEMKLRWR